MALLYFLQQRNAKSHVRQFTLLHVSIFALFFSFAYQGVVHGEYITQINIQQGANVDSVYIKLLEKDAPVTVRNFLNYVRDGDYTNSFIHRSAIDSFTGAPFIIQGGGFTFDPALNDGSFTYDAINQAYPGGLQEVPEDVPVINEFGRSNLRGTLAMAKLGTDPNSATSQWFFNLADNSFLDTQNGGFTVFAEVLGNGMDVVDVVAGQPIVDRSDIHFAFGSLPLLDFSADPVVIDNLVRINSISEVLSISSDIDYGTVTPGSNLQPEIVLLNTGDAPVAIGDIGINDSLSPPFTIVGNSCSNGILEPGQRCSVTVLFSPSTSGDFKDEFDIVFPGLGLNYLIKLSGAGGADAIEPDISSGFSSIDFGERDVIYGENEKRYKRASLIRNFGKAPLQLTNITFSPDSGAEFSISDAEFAGNNNCIRVASLAPDETCRLQIWYIPKVAGKHTAKLILESNDPDESPFEVLIFASAVPEADGVDAAIEDAGSNNGDGNNDGIPDSEQSYVVSLPDLKGNYMTYVTKSQLGQSFSDMRIVLQDESDNNPENVLLEAGVHEFALDNVPPNGLVEVGLLLPAGIVPSDYYIYGPTSDNAESHWYNFELDNVTKAGAVFIGVANVTSPDGTNIARNLITLRIQNGGRGDSSDALDTQIVVKSGINYTLDDSGGGLLSFQFLQVIILTLLFLRYCFPRSSRDLLIKDTSN